jgi:hypothetical protein
MGMGSGILPSAEGRNNPLIMNASGGGGSGGGGGILGILQAIAGNTGSALGSFAEMIGLSGEGNIITQAMEALQAPFMTTGVSEQAQAMVSYAKTDIYWTMQQQQMERLILATQMSGLGGMFGFAEGGLIHKPTPAMVGEGPTSEAIVPLPDNRSIPVQFTGGTTGEGGGDKTVNLTQSFDFSNADKQSEARLRLQAERIKKETVESVFALMDKGGGYAKRAGRRN